MEERNLDLNLDTSDVGEMLTNKPADLPAQQDQPQPDVAVTIATKRTRRKKTEDVQTEDEPSLNTEAIESDQESGEEKEQEVEPSPRRRLRKNADAVVSIDGTNLVDTEDKKRQEALLDLVGSMKSGVILTDTLSGVERPTEDRGLRQGVVYHGDFKVVLPAEQCLELPDEMPPNISKESWLNYHLRKRLGAPIDYIVKGIDAESGLAVASRLEGMAARRREYYLATHGRPARIQVGMTVEVPVVCVVRAGIVVDMFGIETFIPLRELDYQRWFDANNHMQVGQRVLAKILEIENVDRKLRIRASVKQAKTNPAIKAIQKYSIGNQYIGTVAMVDTYGIFVSLDGIDCLCKHSKRGRPPKGAMATVRVLGIDYKETRMWGIITHVTMPQV